MIGFAPHCYPSLLTIGFTENELSQFIQLSYLVLLAYIDDVDSSLQLSPNFTVVL